MNTTEFFDAELYFASLCVSNKLAKANGFKPCTCSGIQSLEGPLEKYRNTNAFFCIDDVNDGQLYQGKGGGWYKKRTFTVFIMHRYTFNNEEDRLAKLALCRQLFRQTATRMLVDAKKLRSDLVYLGVENIMCRELGQYFLNGCTGLYFMIDVEEPVNLTYNPEEWTDE